MASLKKRGKTYYAQYYVNGKQKRVNLQTESLQTAKEKLRAIESAMFRQDDIPLPTKTPLGEILEKYLSNLQARSKQENALKTITYLRGAFGQVCDSLKIKNQASASKAIKRPCTGLDPKIEISFLEHLTAKQVSEFLADIVRAKGVAPRTVNHYRQTLVTLCNWAMRERVTWRDSSTEDRTRPAYGTLAPESEPYLSVRTIGIGDIPVDQPCVTDWSHHLHSRKSSPPFPLSSKTRFCLPERCHNPSFDSILNPTRKPHAGRLFFRSEANEKETVGRPTPALRAF